MNWGLFFSSQNASRQSAVAASTAASSGGGQQNKASSGGDQHLRPAVAVSRNRQQQQLSTGFWFFKWRGTVGLTHISWKNLGGICRDRVMLLKWNSSPCFEQRDITLCGNHILSYPNALLYDILWSHGKISKKLNFVMDYQKIIFLFLVFSL